MAKLSSFKVKERILAEARKMEHKGIQIYEDFSKATAEIRKKNWEKVKAKSPKISMLFWYLIKYRPQVEICRFSSYKFCFIK